MSKREYRTVAPVATKKKPEGIIAFNRNLGWRCVDGRTGRCVLSGVSLTAAKTKYPNFEVEEKR